MACGCGGDCCGGSSSPTMLWADDCLEPGALALTTTQTGTEGSVGGTGSETTSSAPSPVTSELLEWLTDWWPLALAIAYVLWRSR